MSRRKHIISLLGIAAIGVGLGLLSFYRVQADPEASPEVVLLQPIADRTVSTEEQHLFFQTPGSTDVTSVQLVLSGTYGSIAITPALLDGKPLFVIPSSFTKHAGVVTYHLVQQEQSIQQGTFNLLPATETIGAVETYLGPRSIVANVRDYTMLVSIPTDTLDNMLPDSTQVFLKSQFKNSITTTDHYLSNGFAWKRIFSPLKTGRLSTGSTLEDRSSKELIADIFPDTAQDFSITTERNHDYADGNEIITFGTSQIKDIHGNLMTDGTLVTFYMKDSDGAQWQINASTVNGYAFAKALHPQSPSTWQITAAITGVAKSEVLTQTFTPIIQTIPVQKVVDRQLKVGPLTSYLGQLVQDGITVTLYIGDQTFESLSRNGEATFYLKEEDFQKGIYEITIQTLGIETTRQITLD